MPSIGITEMIIVLVVILIFIRPEDLPKFLRTIGKFYGQAQRYYYQMKMYSRQTFDDISRMDQPPPDPSEDPWHNENHDDHYHDDHHDYHHDHEHDEYHDHHHDDFDAQHHEYEAAYAIGDACDGLDALEDSTTPNTTDAHDSVPAGPQSNEPPPAEAAPPPKLTPEPAAGTISRGDTAPPAGPKPAPKPEPPADADKTEA